LLGRGQQVHAETINANVIQRASHRFEHASGGQVSADRVDKLRGPILHQSFQNAPPAAALSPLSLK
jgi:hypothetical protein